MKNRFFLITAFASLFIFSGCSKDDDKPQPVTPVAPSTKGSLTFIASPANAAARIDIIRGTDTVKAFPDAYGVFNVTGLEANNYNVVFTPNPFFEKPADRTAVIKAEQVTDFGTLSFTQKVDGMAAKIDGVDWNYVYYSNNMLSGNVIEINGWEYGNFQIVLEIPFAEGTYTNLTNPNIKWNCFGAQGGPNKAWSSDLGGNATVKITKIDQINKKVSGTFSFTANANPATNATGVVKVTDGTFINVDYN